MQQLPQTAKFLRSLGLSKRLYWYTDVMYSLTGDVLHRQSVSMSEPQMLRSKKQLLCTCTGLAARR